MSIDHTPNQGDLRVDPETRRRIEVYARAAGITPADLDRIPLTGEAEEA